MERISKLPEEKSSYDEGSLQLARIDALLQDINLRNLNLAIFDEDIGDYNYQIKYNNLLSLFGEVTGNVSTDEQKIQIRYKDMIDNLFLSSNPHQEKKVMSGWGTIKKEMQFSQIYFDSLKKLLYAYEMFVRKLVDRYFRSRKVGSNKKKVVL